MKRAVYLAAGEVQCAGGGHLDAVVSSCLQHPPRPSRYRAATQLGTVEVPYFPFADTQAPMQRLQALAAGLLDGAGLEPGERRRLGLFVGTSSGLLHDHERDYIAALAQGDADTAMPLRNPQVGKPAEDLAQQLGTEGPRLTFTTACSASANALLYASWMIREGVLDHALVVATEFSNQLSLLGFHGLALMAPERCRPFDIERSGVVLGEGLACALLSHRQESAQWEILGGANLCDASHPTSASAGMIALTMRQALDDAGLRATDIVTVKAHGTGTPSNDLAEGLALREVFGPQMPPVSSIKPVFGHTLGACGVVELLVYARCLQSGWIPPTAGFTDADPVIGLIPVSAPLEAPSGAVMLNTFGFGGNNCCLALRPC